MSDAASDSSGSPDKTDSSQLGDSVDPGGQPIGDLLFPAHGVETELYQKSVRRAIRFLNILEVRETLFGPLFPTHPGWHILLSLLATGMPGGKFKVSSLSSMAQLPHSTSARWSRILAKRGYLIREGDPKDDRRVLVSLSPKGLKLLQVYFETLRQRGLLCDE